MEQRLLEFSLDMINRTTGHARFRRSTPAAAAAPTILDFSKASVEVERDYLGLSLSLPDYTLPSSSTTTTTNSSSITADGSVSNTHHIMKPPPPPSQCKHPDTHYHPSSSGNKLKSFSSGKSSRCHCTKQIRKRRVKAMIRVPAISSKAAEIPADEYSWRKYGQKPIKGSSFPRAYYKCSTFRGCPARKHVERAIDDPEMLIVTYQGHHRHDQGSSLSLLPLGQSQH